MRVEIKRLHQRLGSTIVYVTHDQVEAMTMADRIVVMREGRILQVGTPSEIYARPADTFTAGFIGSPTMNMLPATLTDRGIEIAGAEVAVPFGEAGGRRGPVLLGVRAHDLLAGAAAEAGGLVLSGPINTVEPLGAETLVHVAIADRDVIATAPGTSSLRVGETVTLQAGTGALYLFDPQTERFIGRA
jgi:multiple sugar transport system ATP-binding protein